MITRFDHYTLRARLQPAFLALVPLALGVFAWAHPGAKWLTATWTLLITVGFTFFLATVARNRGKSIERKLWESWGGPPTTQLLRHSGPGNPNLWERWHKRLSTLLGKALPTPEEERNDPARADEIYEAATRLMIGKTRDKKRHEFVYRENVNYGFCRNLYGLRLTGIIVAIVGIGVSLAATRSSAPNPDYLPWICSAACLVILFGWLFIVTPGWVKIPAMNYAFHLFDATETLTNSGKADEPRSAKSGPSKDKLQKSESEKR